jgi:hypothetical protein
LSGLASRAGARGRVRARAATRAEMQGGYVRRVP